MTGKAACTAFLILAAITLGKADVVSHTESLTSTWNSALGEGEGEQFIIALENYTGFYDKIRADISTEDRLASPLNELEEDISSVLNDYNIDQTDYVSVAQSFQDQNPNQQLNFLGSLLGAPLRLTDKVLGSIYREDGSASQAGRKLLGLLGRRGRA